MDIKQIKFLPNIAENDLNNKIKQIDKLLAKGKHVKCIVNLPGRNILHPENAENILDKIFSVIQNGKLVNRTPLKEKSVEMFLAPKVIKQ